MYSNGLLDNNVNSLMDSAGLRFKTIKMTSALVRFSTKKNEESNSVEIRVYRLSLFRLYR